MKKSLKQLLLLLLLVTCIINLNENSYAAVTWTEIENQIQGVKENIDNGTAPTVEHATTFNNIYNWVTGTMWTNVKAYINSSMTNMNEPINKVVFCSDSTKWLHILIGKIATPSLTTNTTTNKITGSNWYDFRFHDNNGTLESDLTLNPTIGTTTPQYWYQYFMCNIETSVEYKYQVGDNLYTWNENSNYVEGIQLIGGNAIVGENQFYTQFRIGYFWDINNVDLKLYYLNDNDEKMYITNVTKEFTQSHLDGINDTRSYICLYDYNNTIPLNTPLYNELYYNNKYVSTSPWYKVSKTRELPISGKITNASGDTTGNIDLEGIETRLDNINAAIISGDYEIVEKLKQNESGEKQRFDFWKATYNALFQLDSGDVRKIKEKMAQTLELQNNPNYLDELGFLEDLENIEPRDFIISWGKFTYQGTELWSSGDINFSQYTRENRALGNLHGIIRIIFTGIISILLIKEQWRIFCILLGIGTEVYDKANEEHEIIESVTHDTIINADGSSITRRITNTKYPNGNRKIVKGKPINISRG